MNRLLSILVTLFILFLVYLWINHLMGARETEKTGAEPQTTVSGDTDHTPSETYAIPDDDIPSEDLTDTVKTTRPETTIEQPAPEPKKPGEPGKPPQEKPVAPKTTPPPVTPPKSTEIETGIHLVIAGNFLERANAEERVKELRKLGYTNAEVINFELSEYHTACAGRYTDLNEARRVAKKLKDINGIDTYVRHGN